MGTKVLSGGKNILGEIKIVKAKDKLLKSIVNYDPTGAVGDLLKYKSEEDHPLMLFGCGVY
jgi:hypothetical protein